MDGRPLLGAPVAKNSGNYINKLGVDDNGQVRVLPVSDIECVTASGDYVEIHVADSSFLKKETIAALENLLDPHTFCRVHRSSIVNANKITGITSRGSGTYALSTASGRVVTSSRSYRNAVKDLRKSG